MEYSVEKKKGVSTEPVINFGGNESEYFIEIQYLP